MNLWTDVSISHCISARKYAELSVEKAIELLNKQPYEEEWELGHLTSWEEKIDQVEFFECKTVDLRALATVYGVAENYLTGNGGDEPSPPPDRHAAVLATREKYK